jgi:hypothetical protein
MTEATAPSEGERRRETDFVKELLRRRRSSSHRLRASLTALLPNLINIYHSLQHGGPPRLS